MFGKKKKNKYEEVVEEGRDAFDVDYNDDEDFETDFISLDDDEDEQPKRGGIGKKVGITFGVILAVLVVAYVGMAFYFDSHFMFNTTTVSYTHLVKREPVPELKGARALVVDDDAQTCMSVSRMLREIEMTADWTTSGKEAVLRAKEAYEQNQEFKVYIIDWLMPDMNGIETVRRIRMVVGEEDVYKRQDPGRPHKC